MSLQILYVVKPNFATVRQKFLKLCHWKASLISKCTKISGGSELIWQEDLKSLIRVKFHDLRDIVDLRVFNLLGLGFLLILYGCGASRAYLWLFEEN